MGLFGRKANKETQGVDNHKNAKLTVSVPDIQIMMLGARRVGKTSVLASMTREFNIISKDTNLVLTKPHDAKQVNDALYNMENYFKREHKPLSQLTLDDNATKGFVSYDLKLDVSGRNRSIRPRCVRFLDCAGEWINDPTRKEEDMKAEIEKSSVIIIAIDSVLLMEKKGIYNRQNCPEEVTDFIKNNMRPGELANGQKMVLFVPLKCEKYYYQNIDRNSKYYGNRMNELRNNVKQCYSDLLAYLCNEENRKYFTVAIMPILTLGGIEFDHFEDDGVTESITSDSTIYSYCDSDNDKYSPKFCEQPLLYALLYEQAKIHSDYYSKAYTNAGNKKVSAKIKEWFYEKRNWAMDTDYERELEKLKKKVKVSDDGYEIIQKVF